MSSGSRSRARSGTLPVRCRDRRQIGPSVGDPTRLLQVLLNLLGNAIKFTEFGEVALRVTPDAVSSVPGALRFTISDTGIGIPGEKLGTVFEPFTQADSSTTRRYGGSGLGLTISKRLVEPMGGRIWVESGLGKGSVFSFAVPLEIWAGARRQAAVPVGKGPEPPLPALHILLVEDSADNSTITLAYLQDTPYRVEIADNGSVAYKKFTAEHYDLVLMDRQMPDMDGLSATRAMRAWEQANHRPPTVSIALTASALKGDQEKFVAAGCTAYPRDFLSNVRRLFNCTLRNVLPSLCWAMKSAPPQSLLSGIVMNP